MKCCHYVVDPLWGYALREKTHNIFVAAVLGMVVVF